MSYTKDNWRRRHSERADLSTSLIHLTKPNSKMPVIEVMFKILDELTLTGSAPDTGFIVGDSPAVCFQDAPVHAVCQNCWFEQKLREVDKRIKKRYTPTGFLFSKQKIYNSSGRPVIYDQKNAAKEYLPESEWWRIVSFDISKDDSFIDWTHEREWRVKGDFQFKIKDVTLLFANSGTYAKFVKLCDDRNKLFYKDVAGIIVTDQILF